jgi:two-component system, cell cycle sensor histidine kinase and response regulator CckA
VAHSLLIVDDEPALRNALHRFFTRRGWSVSEAGDGEEAMRVIEEHTAQGHRFDVVFTDLKMPKLGGVGLHAHVTQSHPAMAMRFIFASGDTTDEESAAFLSTTTCPVLPKPYELPALLAAAEHIARNGH